MQFIDLQSQYLRIQTEVQQAVADVLSSQAYIMGPAVDELEQRLAAYVGIKHAITCSSGTDALVIPLMAFELDKNDAVFVPSFTFFASAESITLAGGTPVFVDSDPRTFNLTLKNLQAAYARVVTEGKFRPRGILAVDLFGIPADYDTLASFAREHDLFLIEDAAQAFGATYKGRRAGSFGDVAATSFFPAKPLGCYGDGGAIFTNDDDLAQTLRSIRVHGQGTDKYDNIRIGINGRLDTIQAVILLKKLAIFDTEITTRNEAAAAYTQALQDILETPFVPNGVQSVWAQYSLLAAGATEREAILAALKAKDIPAAVYYRVPIHLSTAYGALGYQPGNLPVCEDLAQRIFSLPMHPYLSNNDIKLITDTIKEAL
ncbi:MAG: DegT/DnrJ/EryC1/StrS family aminotransferase [Coriobacteriales bacterium]|jgi:dTDP-4-amino-4,6-dideoxygalactose transaminase|nr:DegT/DnrJ/EryC1/StrS family aminotransferase [Coriobacteriales bacterium]